MMATGDAFFKPRTPIKLTSVQDSKGFEKSMSRRKQSMLQQKFSELKFGFLCLLFGVCRAR